MGTGRRSMQSMVVVLVVLGSAWPASPADAGTRSHAGGYAGTLTFSSDWEGRSGGPVFNRIKASVTFDARFVTTVPSGGGLPVTTGTIRAQGTYDAEATNGSRVDTKRCTFGGPARANLNGFSAAPGNSGASLNSLVDQLVVRSGDCPGTPSAWFGLDACGTSGCTGVCEEDYSGSQAPGFARFQQDISPVVRTFPKTGSRTTAFDATVEAGGPCFTGTQSVTVSINSALTLGGSGVAAAPPKRRPTADQRAAKLAALETFREAWNRALTACAGVAVFGTLSAAGPAGEVAALILVPAEAIQCEQWYEVLDDAAYTVKDPPLASDDIVARVSAAPATKVPTCATGTPAQAAFCSQLRTAVQRFVEATRRTRSVMHAIELTVSRESYAQAHGHTEAARRQDRALHGLNPSLAAARRGESAAGRTVATLMRGAGLSIVRDAAQAAAQTDGLLAGLARRGVSRAKVRSVDAALLTPKPGDWLAALGGG